MKGNGTYRLYTPNNIDPHKLSRNFLLEVNNTIKFFIGERIY